MAAEILATSSPSDALAGASEATEFGAAMRDMRLAHKAELATVASTLRIRLIYLEAIEEGRFTDLPGPTYAAGFVRAYAEYLGLDLSEVMRRYREVALGSDRQAPLVAPSPVVEGTMPTGFILLVAAFLAAAAYGSWYYLTLNGRDAGEFVAQIPQQIAEIVGLGPTAPETPAAPPKPAAPPEPAAAAPQMVADEPSPAPSAVVEAAPPAVSENPPAPAAAEPNEPAPTIAEAPAENRSDRPTEPADAAVEVARPEASSAVTPSVEAVEPAASPPNSVSVLETARDTATAAGRAAVTVPAPAAGPAGQFDPIETTYIPPRTAPVATAPVPDARQTAALPASPPRSLTPAPASRVVLRATAISWVELRDANGNRVFSRLLKKGETYNVPGRAGITLATGNAGALDVLVDGQTIGPLGPLGAVRRDVLLEPDALLKRGRAGQ